jgi:hypothetical protein
MREGSNHAAAIHRAVLWSIREQIKCFRAQVQGPILQVTGSIEAGCTQQPATHMIHFSVSTHRKLPARLPADPRVTPCRRSSLSCRCFGRILYRLGLHRPEDAACGAHGHQLEASRRQQRLPLLLGALLAVAPVISSSMPMPWCLLDQGVVRGWHDDEAT